jgi:hypothetical protein
MGCVKLTVKMQDAPPRAIDSSNVGFLKWLSDITTTYSRREGCIVFTDYKKVFLSGEVRRSSRYEDSPGEAKKLEVTRNFVLKISVSSTKTACCTKSLLTPWYLLQRDSFCRLI